MLFIAHDGVDLRLNVGAEHMDGRGAGLEADAVVAAPADNLGHLQAHLIGSGHHNAVARGAHLLQGGGHLVILALHRCQLFQKRHECPVVLHREAGALRQNLIVERIRQNHRARHDSAARLHGAHLHPLHVAERPQGGQRRLRLAEGGNLPGALSHGLIELRLHGMLHRQRLHPAW